MSAHDLTTVRRCGAASEPPDLDDLVARADEVGAEAARLAPAAEKNRRLDDSIIRALRETGLLKALHAKRYGGFELSFPKFGRIAQALARHDVATSWVYCILSIHHWWGALAEPELQEEIWGRDPDTLFVDSFAPLGKAEPEGGGFRLSGRWPFLSGVPWAEWAAVGAVVPFAAGEPPEYAMLFLPKKDYRVLDDWNTVGLRGSASSSIEVSGALVPRHRIFRLQHAIATGEAPGYAWNPAPLYRAPFVPALAFAITPPSLGGAEAIAKRFRERATRIPLFAQQRQTELVLSQTTLAEAMVELQALEDLLYRYADELEALGQSGATLDPAGRTRLFGWRAFITRRSRAVATSLVELAGATSIFEDEPIQRFWRDVQVMGQHVALNYEVGMRNYGRTLLGLAPDAPLY